MKPLLPLLLLAGCTTLSEAEYARANRTPTPNLPAFVRVVDDAHAACKAIGAQGEYIYGCSDPWGRRAPGYCLVIVPRDDPGWILAHEKLHCQYGRWHS